MKLNKSPGSDGLTVELYRQFRDDIKNVLISSLNEGFHNNELSHIQKQSVITLLYKKKR